MEKLASDYDRYEELKWFDDTKAGVKGLADSCIKKLPRIFITPPDNLVKQHSLDDIALGIPVIDLNGIGANSISRNLVVQEVRRASETWGFFQVVNHGIPLNILNHVIEGVSRFFEQPNDIKSQYYTRDYTQKVAYNSNFDLYRAPFTNWRDTFFALMTPDILVLEELPTACRDIVVEYSRHVIGLATRILELISEALGLKLNHLNDMGCAEGLAFLAHYYPACPEPKLTLGGTKHADNDFFTILLQDQIGGLQVLHQNHWVDVPPVPRSLVINIGDLLQLVSNERLTSSEHRVLANKKRPQDITGMLFLNISQGNWNNIWSN